MTEFNSVQEITDKLNEVKSKLIKLRKDKALAKRKQKNSVDLRDKKNVLEGLEHLQKSNNKAFSNVSSDDERQKLVDRARELAAEINAVEQEIKDFSKPVKDFDKQDEILANEVNRLEIMRNISIMKFDLDEKVSQSDDFGDVLESVEGIFNTAFNDNGVFEDQNFLYDEFSQDYIKQILSKKFEATKPSVQLFSV